MTAAAVAAAIAAREPWDLAGLDRVVAHTPGDLTAVLEGGVRLSAAQAILAKHGQMLALDPPGDPMIAEIVSQALSGPLRHRYGGPRDLVIGIQLALADGTVARSGSRVIKNVAGYDLAKLVAGSFGTLCAVTEVTVRLHSRPQRTATVVLESADPAELGAWAVDLAARPLEADALDVRWADGAGALLVRFSGPASPARAEALAAAFPGDCRLETTYGAASDTQREAALWEAQREAQAAAPVRVAGRITDLPRALRAAPRVVGRAGVGTFWLDTEDPDPLPPRPAIRHEAPFAALGGGELALMRRVKASFDPDGRLPAI